MRGEERDEEKDEREEKGEEDRTRCVCVWSGETGKQRP
jgi:hypothetical protein